MPTVRVLVVDDSALVRRVLSELLDAHPLIEVVGTAADPFIARDRIKELRPDVLTLDVEMPRMDGLTFLSNLMRLRPMPVVMISSLTEQGADVTLRALELGAIDFVSKPKVDVAHGLEEYGQLIAEKVLTAAKARVSVRSGAIREPGPKLDASAILTSVGPGHHYRTTDRIVAIGASTGGTEAIREVLCRLPADAPGTVITQHIPAEFSGPFARRMNAASAMTVMEAEDGMQILPGHAYIAPGGRHLLIDRSGARYRCRLNDGEPVNRHRPSVDVLFRSVANHAGPNAVGVILTGMGDDGAKGLLEMKSAGAATLAQDEQTSVVWGMPGAAVRVGAVQRQVEIERVAEEILGQVHR
jgi:two-component system chemotaxis response regulator CheB